MSIRPTAIVGFVVFALVLPNVGASAEVSTGSLLEQMTDLRRLAELPAPAYVTRQFSSYNRESVTPADARGWFANLDRGHFLRTEQVAGRTEYVLMDADGPGAIVRLWSARPQGTLRFYIDGEAEPRIEAPMDALLNGTHLGLGEPFGGVRARGWNLYFPIPYARHCKVTCDDGTIFYHINYRTYEPGTKVRSFENDDLKRLGDEIQRTAEQLAAPRKGIALPDDARRQSIEGELMPGQTARLCELTGPKAICEFQVRVEADDLEAALRGAVFEIMFDGQRTVECPLGDFFGTAPGLNPYASVCSGMTGGDDPMMWCRWWMPFARNASIAVENLGSQQLRLHVELATADCAWSDRSLLFHAKWRIEDDIPGRPFSDWTHLECTGNGRFVGGSLDILNPVRRWWGEGDEKIFVDGESFPSHFGTGSEDYYGYAWCDNHTFTHAYHNQPRCDGPRNFGHSSVSRFHVIDDIPFTRSLRFDMENWHHNPLALTTRAAVSYWYARPGGSDFFKPIDAAMVAPRPVPVYEVPRVAGAVEAEDMRVLAGETRPNRRGEDERFSAGQYLEWIQAKTGDRLELEFDVPEAGRHDVLVCLSLGKQACRVRLHINGKPVGEPIDLSHHRNTPADVVRIEDVQLSAGANRLTVEAFGPGANVAAGDDPTFIIGIDYLVVVK